MIKKEESSDRRRAAAARRNLIRFRWASPDSAGRPKPRYTAATQGNFAEDNDFLLSYTFSCINSFLWTFVYIFLIGSSVYCNRKHWLFEEPEEQETRRIRHTCLQGLSTWMISSTMDQVRLCWMWVHFDDGGLSLFEKWSENMVWKSQQCSRCCSRKCGVKMSRIMLENVSMSQERFPSSLYSALEEFILSNG